MPPEPDLAATVAAIAAAQLPSGAIPWEPGRHWDPWNMVEAAMALDAGGLHDRAAAAYAWLARHQRADGSWHAAYVADGVLDATVDANHCAYPAAGLLHHLLCGGDPGFVADLFPMVSAAIDAVAAMQLPGGEIAWARDAAGRLWPEALVTSCCCIHLSLRCAAALARALGEERPGWELTAELVARRVLGGGRFIDKRRYAMDWYYPVLGGLLRGADAVAWLERGWDRFVIPGFGVRCVADRPWVTTGETCELVLALHAAGLGDAAAHVLSWVHQLRAPDGSYWTGVTLPDGRLWPLERTTWSSGAVVLAAACLAGGPAASIFGATVLSGEPAVDAL